jgi:hypothetical protein
MSPGLSSELISLLTVTVLVEDILVTVAILKLGLDAGFASGQTKVV